MDNYLLIILVTLLTCCTDATDDTKACKAKLAMKHTLSDSRRAGGGVGCSKEDLCSAV